MQNAEFNLTLNFNELIYIWNLYKYTAYILYHILIKYNITE